MTAETEHCTFAQRMIRPVDNPPNPWHATHIEWDGEAPDAKLELFEERARSILSENDSPDIPHRWSVNPYRGCMHACTYCLSAETPVLMGDGSVRAIASLRVGDEIYGTELRDRYRRYVRTRVLAHWSTFKPAWRVRLDDGTELIASGDHRFLSDRGWKHVTGAEQGHARRPHLTTSNSLIGTGAFAKSAEASEEYRRGYLCGIIRGDGHLRGYAYEREGRAHGNQYHFRLALTDLEALWRTRAWLSELAVETRTFVFQKAASNRQEVSAIRNSSRADVMRIKQLVAWPAAPSAEWDRGFLAGIFDAEGSYAGGILRITNTDADIVRQIRRCLQNRGFDFAIEARMPDPSSGSERPVMAVRIRGGLREHLRFLLLVDPAITRKRDIEGQAIKNNARLGVTSVGPLGVDLPMFDITTGTGDFIANGVVSHNCYARPSHQHLGFGAGTDFDRKIVVKINAPELLRDAFERRSWTGDTVMFSGNTDCYQPIEGTYALTRACLTVCADYRNPIAIVTKGTLVRRDIDVLSRLAGDGCAKVIVSIPYADDATRKKVEPWASSVAQRFETLRMLSAAGIPTGVMVAPVIPGLNDDDIAEVLTRAYESGARRAAMQLVRLPGEVMEIFDARMREAFPDRARRIDSALMQVRRGKRTESEFGARMTGSGARWEIVRQLFDTTCKRLGMNEVSPAERKPFRRPRAQLGLFDK